MGSTFHQLCPRYSGTLTPTAPRVIGYGKPLPLQKSRNLFLPLINVKMATVVGILTFMSRNKFMLS